MIIMNSLALPLEDNISPHMFKYELVDGSAIIQAEIEDFKIRLWEPENLTTILKEVGFKNIKLIKAFDRTKAYETNDEVIIYECRKEL